MNKSVRKRGSQTRGGGRAKGQAGSPFQPSLSLTRKTLGQEATPWLSFSKARGLDSECWLS